MASENGNGSSIRVPYRVIDTPVAPSRCKLSEKVVPQVPHVAHGRVAYLFLGASGPSKLIGAGSAPVARVELRIVVAKMTSHRMVRNGSCFPILLCLDARRLDTSPAIKQLIKEEHRLHLY